MKRLALILALALPVDQAASQVTWDAELYDPAGDADLTLPMPCGGAMAFQRVSVPVEPDNPIDDRLVRLGQSQEQTAFSDYLRPAFLRGAFTGEAGDTYFYIARYELTEGQYRALRGDCTPPGRIDRLARGGLSWFEAVELGRIYTEWLHREAPDTLPANGGSRGFLRLPTEVEWEYATRGGSRIDASAFGARVFFGEGDIGEYAMIQGAARGRLAPVGIRAPNPLGLFDVYGNAEELMLEPYRLNAIGRAHGQTGGMVTRGGSFRSPPTDITSAARIEYPMFGAEGAALAGDSFGARFVISAPITQDDAYLAKLRTAWTDAANAGANEADDPAAQLARMIEEETDPRREAALDQLQLYLRRSRESVQNALQEAGKSTLLSGAIVIGTLERDALRMNRLQFSLGTLIEMRRYANEARKAELNGQIGGFQEELGMLRQTTRGLLLTYRSALDTLIADFRPEERQAAIDVLRSELSAGGRAVEARLFERFVVDLAAYSEAPDMSEMDILGLALSP